MAKLLENIMTKENQRQNRRIRRIQPSKLPKYIREARKELGEEGQETLLIKKDTMVTTQWEIEKLAVDQTETTELRRNGEG